MEPFDIIRDKIIEWDLSLKIGRGAYIKVKYSNLKINGIDKEKGIILLNGRILASTPSTPNLNLKNSLNFLFLK